MPETIQQKIDAFIRLGNDLDRIAKSRYGPNGFIFHEADGGVYLMSGDSTDGNVSARQRFIKIRSTTNAKWGAGAW